MRGADVDDFYLGPPQVCMLIMYSSYVRHIRPAPTVLSLLAKLWPKNVLAFALASSFRKIELHFYMSMCYIFFAMIRGIVLCWLHRQTTDNFYVQCRVKVFKCHSGVDNVCLIGRKSLFLIMQLYQAIFHISILFHLNMFTQLSLYLSVFQ